MLFVVIMEVVVTAVVVVIAKNAVVAATLVVVVDIMVVVAASVVVGAKVVVVAIVRVAHEGIFHKKQLNGFEVKYPEHQLAVKLKFFELIRMNSCKNIPPVFEV